jgi:hypothetical protein
LAQLDEQELVACGLSAEVIGRIRHTSCGSGDLMSKGTT